MNFILFLNTEVSGTHSKGQGGSLSSSLLQRSQFSHSTVYQTPVLYLLLFIQINLPQAGKLPFSIGNK